MIEKGSVAIDGISLTINQCSHTDFSVSIIPHTAKLTTIGFKQAGDPVNIETDMIGKYVKKIFNKDHWRRSGKGTRRYQHGTAGKKWIFINQQGQKLCRI